MSQVSTKESMDHCSELVAGDAIRKKPKAVREYTRPPYFTVDSPSRLAASLTAAFKDHIFKSLRAERLFLNRYLFPSLNLSSPVLSVIPGATSLLATAREKSAQNGKGGPPLPPAKTSEHPLLSGATLTYACPRRANFSSVSCRLADVASELRIRDK